jgi:glycosyltransferase involved in cell wall biosynthesis
LGNPFKLSVIVSADNDEERVVRVLERIDAQEMEGVELEVVILDNGLPSSALERLEARPDLFAVLVKGPEMGASGTTFGAGLRRATGDYALFQATDLDPAPAEYGTLMRPIIEFGADVVVGTRFKGMKFAKIGRFWEKAGNQATTLLFNLLNNTSLTDIFNSYLVFRRDLVDPDDLRSAGGAHRAEILSKALWGSRVCYEVPVNYFKLPGSGSDGNGFCQFVAAAWVIIRHRLFRIFR